jgi:polyisoprenoid-binding protein YceI
VQTFRWNGRLRAFALAVVLGWGLALAVGANSSVHAAVVSRDPGAVPSGAYKLDPEHASVVVRVSHMGFSRFTLRFDRIAGGFQWDPAHPEAAQASIALDAASLDAGPPKLGPQFAREFLDAEAHPKITFVSTGLKIMADGTGVLSGDLTLAGVTRPVTLNVTFNGVGPGLIGGKRVGFSATGQILRSAFGSSRYLPTLVGDAVDIEIEAEFFRT